MAAIVAAGGGADAESAFGEVEAVADGAADAIEEEPFHQRRVDAALEDAIFDEAATAWVPQALDAGVTLLPLAEATVAKLETMGYRRAILPRSTYHKLPHDVLSLDFSGWTVFVHAEADDDLVTQICAGLLARKARIPWEEPGELPVERMAREAPDTPQTVPLHPAAERFWRACGYL